VGLRVRLPFCPNMSVCDFCTKFGRVDEGGINECGQLRLKRFVSAVLITAIGSNDVVGADSLNPG
jgi:hypothetical protein